MRVFRSNPAKLAEYLLEDSGAAGLDAGEQQLFAHAFQRAKRGDEVWVLWAGNLRSDLSQPRRRQMQHHHRPGVELAILE